MDSAFAGQFLMHLPQERQPTSQTSLTARSLSRLGCTVQLTDAGISPGEGVGNRRPALSWESLGAPVIALGVPTVVDAAAAEAAGTDFAAVLTGFGAEGRFDSCRTVAVQEDLSGVPGVVGLR